MGDDLRQVLVTLYNAGAEDVPAQDIPWDAEMMPAINVALNMGYMRYRERSGVRHFYLTGAGYSKIGVPPFSPWKTIIAWTKSLFRISRNR